MDDIVGGRVEPGAFTLVEGHFVLDDRERETVPDSFGGLVYVLGVRMNGTRWEKLEQVPKFPAFGGVKQEAMLFLKQIKGDAKYVAATPEAAMASDGIKLPALIDAPELTVVPDGQVRFDAFDVPEASMVEKVLAGHDALDALEAPVAAEVLEWPGAFDAPEAVMAEEVLANLGVLDAPEAVMAAEVLATPGAFDSLSDIAIAEELIHVLDGVMRLLDESDAYRKRCLALVEALSVTLTRERVLETCRRLVPQFLKVRDGFRLHAEMDLERLSTLDGLPATAVGQEFYADVSLMRSLGLSAGELLDSSPTHDHPGDATHGEASERSWNAFNERQLRLGHASAILTRDMAEIWGPGCPGGQSARFRLITYGSRLKIMVSDGDGTDIELFQRSEGLQRLVVFIAICRSEISSRDGNVVLLLDDPGSCLEGDKLHRFGMTLSGLCRTAQILLATRSAGLAGPFDAKLSFRVTLDSHLEGTRVVAFPKATKLGSPYPVPELSASEKIVQHRNAESGNAKPGTASLASAEPDLTTLAASKIESAKLGVANPVSASPAPANFVGEILPFESSIEKNPTTTVQQITNQGAVTAVAAMPPSASPSLRGPGIPALSLNFAGYDLAENVLNNLIVRQKNLVVEGITDVMYLKTISRLMSADGESGLDNDIEIIAANSAGKVSSFIDFIVGNHLKVAALVDSDTAGNEACKKPQLMSLLAHGKLLRIRDFYHGPIKLAELEEMLRETLVKVALRMLNLDVVLMAARCIQMPIVHIFKDQHKASFQKMKLADAFARWSEGKSIKYLTNTERVSCASLIKRINKILK
ncbi:MAG: hypothetical protein LBR80_00460 [Deltaproteobacteria bacterium]|nr:hypothetical protein [Deltaproteobacteria bacterium]